MKTASVLVCAFALTACKFLKKDEPDAEAETTPVSTTDAAPADATAAAPALPAKNAADIVRFPSGEAPLSDAIAKTTAVGVAKTGCKSGNLVANVPKGTDVVEVAAYDECFLVTFLDPKSPADRLAGWVTKDAFAASTTVVTTVTVIKDGGVADAGKPALKCTGAQVAVTLGGDPVCHKKCTTDADCHAIKGACVLGAAAAGGKALHVCSNE